MTDIVPADATELPLFVVSQQAPSLDLVEPSPPPCASKNTSGRRPVAALPPAHPLARLGFVVELHPEAGPLGYAFEVGLRCGGCAHRRVAPPEVSGREFPKCAVDGWVWASQAATTDVRSYWPACVDYEPQEKAS